MKICLQLSAREAKNLLLGLFAIELIFLTAYVCIFTLFTEATWGPLRVWFDLDAEANLPTWFSSIQLFVTGAVLLHCYLIQREQAILFPYHFLAAGCAFIFLSADEAAVLHEQLTNVAKYLELDFLLFEGGHGAWIPIYAMLGIVLTVPLIQTAKTLWLGYKHEIKVIILGLLLFVTGAVFLEIVSYQYLRTDADSASAAYRLEVAAEELMEMGGISLVLYAALLLNIRISKDQNPLNATDKSIGLN